MSNAQKYAYYRYLPLRLNANEDLEDLVLADSIKVKGEV